MAHISEYDVETKFIDRLESIGYEYVELKNYPSLLGNFFTQLVKFNEKKLIEAKGKAELTVSEQGRVLTWLENKTVYDSAKRLRDKYILPLDNGETVISNFSAPTRIEIFIRFLIR